jgi:hypothetical protein
MKRALFTAIAFACLTMPAAAGPMCGLPMPVVEKVQADREGSQRLNDIVAKAFLDKFNNTGPLTRYAGPVSIIPRKTWSKSSRRRTVRAAYSSRRDICARSS